MLRIAVCDDYPQELERAVALTRAYLTRSGIEAELASFSQPEALLRAHGDAPFDLFILDVCMPGLSGIQLGKALLADGGDTQFVYVTTSPDYAVDAFALQAAHYLLKPFTEAQFAEALDRAMARLYHRAARVLTVAAEDGARRIPFSEVSYCEGRGNYQYLHLSGGSALRVRLTSAELFLQLSGDAAFARCGASYIVNLEQVRSLNAKALELQDGTRLYIPRGAYPALKSHYFSFYFEEDTP